MTPLPDSIRQRLKAEATQYANKHAATWTAAAKRRVAQAHEEAATIHAERAYKLVEALQEIASRNTNGDLVWARTAMANYAEQALTEYLKGTGE